jgi:hypothetical protein
MSAKSRAREEEQRKKLEEERYKDLPSGDEVDAPDPEFDRLLAWFIENREGLAEHLNCDKVIVDGQKGILLLGKRRNLNERLKPVQTIRYGPDGKVLP